MSLLSQFFEKDLMKKRSPLWDFNTFYFNVLLGMNV